MASKNTEEEASSALAPTPAASVSENAQSVTNVLDSSPAVASVVDSTQPGAESTPAVADSSASVSDNEVAPVDGEKSSPEVNVDSLRSLSDIGIDVSFLKDFGKTDKGIAAAHVCIVRLVWVFFYHAR